MSKADINFAQDLHSIALVYGIDPDLVLQRRFLRLHHFNLYNKHKRLVELDKSVADLETLKHTIHPNGPQPGGTVEETLQLAQLLKNIEEALKDFDTASCMYQRSLSAPEVPPYLLKQVKQATEGMARAERYFDHYDIESGWKECALHTATEKSLLHRTIDRFPWLRSIFVQKGQEEDAIMLSYSENRVRRVVDIFINLSFCLVVLIPTIALSYMKSKTLKLIVLVIFVLLSAVVSSFLATTMHKSSLAVIAGYTAILVVFLSNNPGT